MSTEQSVVEIR